MNKIIFQIYISNSVNISFSKTFEKKKTLWTSTIMVISIGKEISYISRFRFYLTCKITGHTTEYWQYNNITNKNKKIITEKKSNKNEVQEKNYNNEIKNKRSNTLTYNIKYDK